MTSTTYGYKVPDTGDLSKGSTGWMQDLNYNWNRIDSHSHTGTDSAIISYFKGGTATGSFNQMTLPSNTTANLTALSRVAGNVYWSSDGLVPYFDNGTSLVAINSQTSPSVPQITKYTANNGATNYKFTVTAANATVGATYTNNGQTFTVLSTIAGGTTLYCSGTGTPNASGNLTKGSGTGDSTIAFSVMAAVYIPPSGALYLHIKMVGGGGGGAGCSNGAADAGAGGDGGDTTFGSSLTAAGGKGGAAGGSTTGAGGSGTISVGSGIVVVGQAGGSGCALSSSGASTNLTGGASGGSSMLGGGAPGGGTNGVAGVAAIANSGGGGSGASVPNANNSRGGGGGAGGGGVDVYITSSIAASYAYSIGSGGTAGTAGTSGTAGGAGGSGVIIVTAYFQ